MLFWELGCVSVAHYGEKKNRFGSIKILTWETFFFYRYILSLITRLSAKVFITQELMPFLRDFWKAAKPAGEKRRQKVFVDKWSDLNLLNVQLTLRIVYMHKHTAACESAVELAGCRLSLTVKFSSKLTLSWVNPSAWRYLTVVMCKSTQNMLRADGAETKCGGFLCQRVSTIVHPSAMDGLVIPECHAVA